MAIGNSVNDEVLEQHKLMKGRPLKEQIAYFGGYYWKHALVIIAVIIFVGSFIHTLVTAKKDALHVMFVNTFIKDELNVEEYELQIAQDLGIDTKKQAVVLETSIWVDFKSLDELSMANWQKVMVEYAAGTLDALLVDDAYIENNKQANLLSDLTEVLPAEVLAKYEDRLIYTDVAVDEKGEFPVGIDVSDAAILEGGGLEAYYCFSNNIPHLETSIAYLEYILGY